jgi:hypothetical protein
MTRTLPATLVALSLALPIAAAQTPQAPQAPKPQTEAAAAQPQAKNLMQDVTRVGCLKAWQPGPADAATDARPPKASAYVLTPINADPVKKSVDLPTYLLVGGSTVNFAAHQNHKVEIAGVEQAAAMPQTVQETVNAPMKNPENKSDTKTMPTLTVRSLKMISATCS